MANHMSRALFCAMLLIALCAVRPVRGDPDLWSDLTGARGVVPAAPLRWIPRDRAQPGVVLNAVVVGINDYQDRALRLRFAVKDAQAFAAVLGEQRSKAYQIVRIEKLLDQAATAASIKAKLQWLVKTTGPGEVAVFFMAGHGKPDSANAGHLLLSAVDEGAGGSEDRFGSADLRRLARECRGTVLIFLDTCYSGSALFPESIEGVKIQMASDPDNIQRRVVLFAATARNGVARESGRLEHGIFTQALIKGLRGGADYQGNGEITASALANFTYSYVRKYSDEAQEPLARTPLVTTDFVISRLETPFYQRPLFWSPLLTALAGAAATFLIVERPWARGQRSDGAVIHASSVTR